MSSLKKLLVATNIILVVLELIAFIHDMYVFSFSAFKWYTIDSNVLQLVVSLLVVVCYLKKAQIPDFVTKLHFVSAVALTVTFLIAAFVLAPEGGYAYYFIYDVAPINHLIGPALSVASLLFLEKTDKCSLKIILYPLLATMAYGIICLILNIMRILDGPYFFLKIYDVPAGTIAMWFAIIGVLCVVIAFAYYKIKWRSVK